MLLSSLSTASTYSMQRFKCAAFVALGPTQNGIYLKQGVYVFSSVRVHGPTVATGIQVDRTSYEQEGWNKPNIDHYSLPFNQAGELLLISPPRKRCPSRQVTESNDCFFLSKTVQGLEPTSSLAPFPFEALRQKLRAEKAQEQATFQGAERRPWRCGAICILGNLCSTSIGLLLYYSRIVTVQDSSLLF